MLISFLFLVKIQFQNVVNVLIVNKENSYFIVVQLYYK